MPKGSFSQQGFSASALLMAKTFHVDQVKLDWEHNLRPSNMSTGRDWKLGDRSAWRSVDSECATVNSPGVYLDTRSSVPIFLAKLLNGSAATQCKGSLPQCPWPLSSEWSPLSAFRAALGTCNRASSPHSHRERRERPTG